MNCKGSSGLRRNASAPAANACSRWSTAETARTGIEPLSRAVRHSASTCASGDQQIYDKHARRLVAEDFSCCGGVEHDSNGVALGA